MNLILKSPQIEIQLSEDIIHLRSYTLFGICNIASRDVEDYYSHQRPKRGNKDELNRHGQFQFLPLVTLCNYGLVFIYFQTPVFIDVKYKRLVLSSTLESQYSAQTVEITNMSTSQQTLSTGSAMEDKDISDLENNKPETVNGEPDVEKGEERSKAPAVLDWDGPDDPGNPLNVSNWLLYSHHIPHLPPLNVITYC